MKMTGVEVPFETLSKPEPNTIWVVILDKDGAKRLVKVNNQSIADNEMVLTVTASTGAQPQSGCYVMIGGIWVWKDPCPF